MTLLDWLFLCGWVLIFIPIFIYDIWLGMATLGAFLVFISLFLGKKGGG